MEEKSDGLTEPKEKLVLVVDDDEGQRDLLKHLLGKEGFKLAEAQSGADALKKVKELSPDLILLDLMLPVMGGYEIVRELQATGSGDIPVIITTARSMDAKMIATLTAEPNVRGFFPKPPSPKAFRETVHALLKTRPPAFNPPKDFYGP